MYSYYEHLVKAVREYATDKPGNLGGLLGTLGGSRNNGGLSLRRPPPAEPVVRSLHSRDNDARPCSDRDML